MRCFGCAQHDVLFELRHTSKMKNFTSFADAGNYHALLQQALEIRANPNGYQRIGRNKTVGLIFFNP